MCGYAVRQIKQMRMRRVCTGVLCGNERPGQREGRGTCAGVHYKGTGDEAREEDEASVLTVRHDGSSEH